MLQNWNYAKLSKAVKEAGGPERYVEMLKHSGKMEMLPWVGISAVSASVITAVTLKVIEYHKTKNKRTQENVEYTKKELLKGIKEYDSTPKDERSDEEIN